MARKKKKSAQGASLDKPENRVEKYLAKIAKLTDGSDDLGYPQNRLERFLAKLAGYTDEFPDGEYSRLERYLKMIETGGGGGEKIPASDVNFFDYDGTIVASYTAASFLALSTMPKNPSHDGLTSRGWNYTLADAKNYVANYGKLNIGQMYTVDDGKTHIYIKLDDGRLAPYLGMAINGTATVEWGDGQTSTVTGNSTSTVVNTQHTYARAGEYVIKIAVTGSLTLLGDSSYNSQVLWKNTSGSQNKVYRNAIQKIEIGSDTSIGECAFQGCNSLKSVIIPYGTISIGKRAFYDCNSLAFVAIPNTVTSIGYYAFFNCLTLAYISIPDSAGDIGDYVLQYCGSLTSITIPESATIIGYSAFYGCNVLASITIPSRVTKIERYAFNSCYGLGFIMFTPTVPPNVIDANAWDDIPTDCIIYVPRGSLSAYTSASNYPSSQTYTYVEYDQ